MEYSSGQHPTRHTALLGGFCILVRGHRKAGHGAKWPLRAFLWVQHKSNYKWIKWVVSACKFQSAHTWQCQEISVKRQPQEHLSSFTAQQWHHPPWQRIPRLNCHGEMLLDGKRSAAWAQPPVQSETCQKKTRASRRAGGKYRSWCPKNGFLVWNTARLISKNGRKNLN